MAEAFERAEEMGVDGVAGPPAAVVLTCSWADVRDPAPLLATLRQQQGHAPVWLAWDRLPGRAEEENYVKLFEEFKPRLCTPSSEEQPPGGPEQIVLHAADSSPESYDLARLSVPTGSFFPPTGEFLQRLMEYTVLDKHKEAELEKSIGIPVPPVRRLYVEETWPAPVYETARSLFVYPEKGLGEAIVVGTWPALRLVCFHNSDHTVLHTLFLDFLERHPNVHIWMTNSLEMSSPRVRTVPLFLSNAYWRGGSVDRDIPFEVCRAGAESRTIPLLFPYCSPTNPVRHEWIAAAKAMRQGRPELEMVGKLNFEDYTEVLETAIAVVSPPGNGSDTHRTWETLLKGGWPILQDNRHTRNLLRDYPSLPLLVLRDGQDLLTLNLPDAVPSPFHPLLLREFWVVQYGSLLVT